MSFALGRIASESDDLTISISSLLPEMSSDIGWSLVVRAKVDACSGSCLGL
jgi:hypothetical protein